MNILLSKSQRQSKDHGGRGGFTLIETLVAITILMIAIVGPLTIAHKGIIAAVEARDRMVASYLAQDAMEYFKNVRDNNKLAGRDWMFNLSSCDRSINPEVSCKVDTISGDPATSAEDPGIVGINACSSLSDCLLTLDDAIGYNTSGQGYPSIYTREFYIEDAGGTGKKRAVVKVSWGASFGQNETVYQNIFFDITR